MVSDGDRHDLAVEIDLLQSRQRRFVAAMALHWDDHGAVGEVVVHVRDLTIQRRVEQLDDQPAALTVRRRLEGRKIRAGSLVLGRLRQVGHSSMTRPGATY